MSIALGAQQAREVLANVWVETTTQTIMTTVSLRPVIRLPSTCLRSGAIALVEKALRWTAALLFLLSGGLWWQASNSMLTVNSPGSSQPSHTSVWWSGMPLGIVVALAVGSIVVRGVAVSRALVGVTAVALGLATTGQVVRSQVLPDPHPATAVGAAVPATLFGFAVSLLACLLLGLALCLRGATQPQAPQRTTRSSAVVTGAVALVLTGMIGAAVVRLNSDYLLSVNEYRTIGQVDRPIGSGQRTRLVGGTHWKAPVHGLRRASWASTRYGIAVTSGSSVVAVNLDTGKQRWRYTRADVSGEPRIIALDGGARLLVSWDRSSSYVLDARTGQRLTHLHWPVGQEVILGDPLIVRRPTDGGTAIVRITSSGRDLWSIDLPKCDRPYVAANGGVLLLSTTATCPMTRDRVLQVAAESGSMRWTVEGVGGPRLAQTSNVVVYATTTEHHTVLTALRLHDGLTSWTRAIQFPHGERPCDDMHVSAAAHQTMIVCGFEETDPDSRWHPASLVVAHNTETGRPLWTSVYHEGVVNSLAIDTHGRAIITRTTDATGCILERLTKQDINRLVIDADDGGLHCSYIDVFVDGEQLVLLDEWTEEISTLR